MKVAVCKHCGENLDFFSKNSHDCRFPFTEDIRRKLADLWFVRGNGGPKHNQQDHYYIQRLVEGRRAEADRCSPTKECKRDVKKILQDN